VVQSRVTLFKKKVLSAIEPTRHFLSGSESVSGSFFS
jgi:hypothetical protein